MLQGRTGKSSGPGDSAPTGPSPRLTQKQAQTAKTSLPLPSSDASPPQAEGLEAGSGSATVEATGQGSSSLPLSTVASQVQPERLVADSARAAGRSGVQKTSPVAASSAVPRALPQQSRLGSDSSAATAETIPKAATAATARNAKPAAASAANGLLRDSRVVTASDVSDASGKGNTSLNATSSSQAAPGAASDSASAAAALPRNVTTAAESTSSAFAALPKSATTAVDSAGRPAPGSSVRRPPIWAAMTPTGRPRRGTQTPQKPAPSSSSKPSTAGELAVLPCPV